MKKIAIVGYAQNKILASAGALNEVELIMPVVHKIFNSLGISQNEIDFTCSGSCDYLQGAAVDVRRGRAVPHRQKQMHHREVAA